jgi:predicted DNA-binding transcriptional regulator YafY
VLDLKSDEKIKYHQADFNANDYFKYGFGVTVYANSTPSIVELWCDESLSGYLLSKPLHASQKVINQDNGLHIQMQCYLTPELEMTILSYGEKMKVLAPDELKERISKRVKLMGGIYGVD